MEFGTPLDPLFVAEKEEKDGEREKPFVIALNRL